MDAQKAAKQAAPIETWMIGFRMARADATVIANEATRTEETAVDGAQLRREKALPVLVTNQRDMNHMLDAILIAMSEMGRLAKKSSRKRGGKGKALN